MPGIRSSRGRRVAVVDAEGVAVRVVEERLEAHARVEDLPVELDPPRLQLGAGGLYVLDMQRDRMVVGPVLEAERIRLHHGEGQAAGLELRCGHVAPALR